MSKYKVGDKVVVSEINPDPLMFPNGTIGVVTKVLNEDEPKYLCYEVEALDDFWYYEDNDLEIANA